MGAFGLGLLQGAATTTNAALQTHIKDNKDRFDKNLTDALARNVANSDRYDKKTRDAKEALELMSGLTNGNLDQAASVIKSIGGVGQTQGFVDSYRKALQTNDSITLDSVVKYIGDQRETDLTNQQAINQLVEPFEFTTPAASVKRTGLAGLFDDPRSIATELPKTLQARGINPTEVGPLIKLQGATVDYSKLRTPEQGTAVRVAEATASRAEQDVNLGNERLAILKDQVKQLPEVNKRAVETHNAAMTSSKINVDDKKKRLSIFEANNTSDMISLSRRLTVAKIIQSESGTDAEEQYNLLDTRALHYRNLIRKNSKDQGVSEKVSEWQEQLKDIRTSKNALVKTMAADASTIYSKDSPKGIFKDKFQATVNSIQGLKYADSVAGMIQNLTEGQAPMVLSAYQQHYKEMRSIYASNPHQGIQDQIKLAESNAKLAENMIFKRAWDNKDVAKIKPKPLYVVVDGVVQLDDQNFAIYNPDVKTGDRVIINDPYMMRIRLKHGYHSKEAIKYSKSILGFRPAGSKTFPIPDSNR